MDQDKHGCIAGETVYNNKDQVITKHISKVQEDNMPMTTKVMVIKVAMKHPLTEERTRVVFQLDCINLIKVINGNNKNIPRNAMGMICIKMWKINEEFYNVRFVHIQRQYNETAHNLANVCVSKSTNNLKLSQNVIGPKTV